VSVQRIHGDKKAGRTNLTPHVNVDYFLCFQVIHQLFPVGRIGCFKIIWVITLLPTQVPGISPRRNNRLCRARIGSPPIKCHTLHPGDILEESPRRMPPDKAMKICFRGTLYWMENSPKSIADNALPRTIPAIMGNWITHMESICGPGPP